MQKTVRKPLEKRKIKMKEISTKETQDLIHKRRVLRWSVTKGISRGELIDRVNAITIGKDRIPKEKVE